MKAFRCIVLMLLLAVPVRAQNIISSSTGGLSIEDDIVSKLRIVVTNDSALHVYNEPSDPSPFVINSHSMVGIGTAGPTSMLEVYGDSNVLVSLTRPSAAGVSLKYGNTAGSMYSGVNGSAAWVVSTSPDLSAARLSVTPSGRVGIGTATPAVAMDIVGGSIAIDNGVGYRSRNPSGALVNLIYYSTASQTVIGANGEIALGGSITLQPPLTADTYVNVDADTDFNVGTGKLFVRGSDGNVGIGTASPSTRLDVSGVFRVDSGGNVQTLSGYDTELISTAANTVQIGAADETSAQLKAPDRTTGDSSAVLQLSSGSSTGNHEGYVEMLLAPAGSSGTGQNAPVSAWKFYTDRIESQLALGDTAISTGPTNSLYLNAATNIVLTPTNGAVRVTGPLQTTDVTVTNTLTFLPPSGDVSNVFQHPRRGVHLYDEFMGRTEVNALGWYSVELSGSTVFSTTLSSANHPGVWYINTGAVTNGYVCYRLAECSVTAGGGQMMYEAVVQLSDLSDATDTFTVWCGLGDSSSGDPTDGIYIKYSHTIAGGSWTGYTAAAGSITQATGGSSVAAVADTWHRLAFVANAAGTSVSFYVDGTFIGTSTSNIPTGTQLCGPEFFILKSAGTGVRNLFIDYMMLDITFSSAR